MAPDSRPPLTHQRPPLAQRIRKSFEGRRKSDANNRPESSNASSSPDPDALRKAVEEAINGAAFQNAIATSLAKIIEPSITSALDTIQPLVESVYSHDILLRRTNDSVEDMLHKMDTIHEEGLDDGNVQSQRERSLSGGSYNDMEFKALLEKSNKRTVATLAELSNAVQSNNARIAGMENLLGETKGGVESLKSYLHHQLDEFMADLARISETLESGNISQVEGTTKLDALATDLAAFKGLAQTSDKIDSISAELNLLRASVDAGLSQSNEGFTGLGSQLSAVSATMEAHGTTLEDVRNVSNTKGILEAVQKSNNSHDSHAVVLAEIKDKSLEQSLSEAGGSDREVSESLKDLTTHLEALRENVEAGLASSNENVSSLGTQIESIIITLETQKTAAPTPPVASIEQIDTAPALEDIKASLAAIKENIENGISLNSEGVAGLGSRIDTVLSTLEGHRSADQSADILAAIQKSNDSHDSHSSALEGIKSLVVLPVPTSTGSDLSAVETKIGTILTALESQTASLDEIKVSNTATSRELIPTEDTLKLDINTILNTLDNHTKSLDDIRSVPTSTALIASEDSPKFDTEDISIQLDSHAKLLNELKDDISAEILSALHEIGEIQAHHTSILTEIKEADVSDEILTALHTSIEAHTNHEASFGQLYSAVQASNESHEKHGAELGEIKERSLSFVPTTVSERTGLSELESRITMLASTLDEQKATLDQIREVTTSSTDALGEIKSKALDHSSSLDLDVKISGIITSLEEQRSALDHIKDATNSSIMSHATHTAILDELRSKSLEPVSSSGVSGLSDLDTKISGIVTALEEHNSTLTVIKDATTSSVDSHAATKLALSEIKDVAIAARDLHESHSSVLSEIKDVTVASRDLHNTHTDALSEIKDVTVASRDLHGAHSATLADLVIATGASNDAHANHTAILSELKSIKPAETLSETPATLTLETDIKTIITTLESQIVTLTDIKDATIASKELQSSHSSTLADLVIATGTSNDAHISHTTALSELKSNLTKETPSEIPGLAGVETDLKSILETLSSQTSTLSHLKDTTANSELLNTFKSSQDLLTSHTALLESIKTKSSNEEIMSSLTALKSLVEETRSGVDTHGTLIKDLHSETKDSHSSLSTTLSALAVGGAVGGGAGLLAGKSSDDDNSAELLLEVKAVREIVERSSTNTENTLTSVTSISEKLDVVSTGISELQTDFNANTTAVERISEKAGSVVNESKSSSEDINRDVLSGAKDMDQPPTATVDASVVSVREVDGSHSSRARSEDIETVEPKSESPPVEDSDTVKKPTPTEDEQLDDLAAVVLESPIKESPLEPEFNDLATTRELVEEPAVVFTPAREGLKSVENKQEDENSQSEPAATVMPVVDEPSEPVLLGQASDTSRSLNIEESSKPILDSAIESHAPTLSEEFKEAQVEKGAKSNSSDKLPCQEEPILLGILSDDAQHSIEPQSEVAKAVESKEEPETAINLTEHPDLLDKDTVDEAKQLTPPDFEYSVDADKGAHAETTDKGQGADEKTLSAEDNDSSAQSTSSELPVGDKNNEELVSPESDSAENKPVLESDLEEGVKQQNDESVPASQVVDKSEASLESDDLKDKDVAASISDRRDSNVTAKETSRPATPTNEVGTTSLDSDIELDENKTTKPQTLDEMSLPSPASQRSATPVQGVIPSKDTEQSTLPEADSKEEEIENLPGSTSKSENQSSEIPPSEPHTPDALQHTTEHPISPTTPLNVVSKEVSSPLASPSVTSPDLEDSFSAETFSPILASKYQHDQPLSPESNNLDPLDQYLQTTSSGQNTAIGDESLSPTVQRSGRSSPYLSDVTTHHAGEDWDHPSERDVSPSPGTHKWEPEPESPQHSSGIETPVVGKPFVDESKPDDDDIFPLISKKSEDEKGHEPGFTEDSRHSTSIPTQIEEASADPTSPLSTPSQLRSNSLFAKSDDHEDSPPITRGLDSHEHDEVAEDVPRPFLDSKPSFDMDNGTANSSPFILSPAATKVTNPFSAGVGDENQHATSSHPSTSRKEPTIDNDELSSPTTVSPIPTSSLETSSTNEPSSHPFTLPPLPPTPSPLQSHPITPNPTHNISTREPNPFDNTSLKSPPLPEATDDEADQLSGMASPASTGFADEVGGSGGGGGTGKKGRGKKAKRGKKGKKAGAGGDYDDEW